MSKRTPARPPLTVRAPSRPGTSRVSTGGPGGSRGAAGPAGPPGDSVLRRTLHIEDFGAVPINLGEDQEQASPALRSANVDAINRCFAEALAAPNGATIYMGPGIYLTNDAVGYNLTIDKNVNVIVQGLSGWTSIKSNNLSVATLQFRTTSGNLRQLYVRDIILRGGREGLLLVWVAYSVFERIWFWGSKNFGLQNEAGNGNVFYKCRFDESAQGTSSGVEADAALLVSCEDTISHCNFGEYCGGVLVSGGASVIDTCIFHDCTLRRAIWFNYVTSAIVDLSATLIPLKACVTMYGSSLNIVGCYGNTRTRFVTAFRAYELVMSGVRMQTEQGGVGFNGFVEVYAGGGTELALNIAGSTFVWLGSSGFFIKDDSALNHAMVSAQLVLYSPATMTALSSSAPTLLNPGAQDNLVVTRAYPR